MLNESFHKLLNLFTDVTKLTITCLSNLQRSTPIYTRGINITLLKEFAEYVEVENFLESTCLKDIESNTFYSYYTKKRFIYNIAIINIKGSYSLEIISGPILELTQSGKAFHHLMTDSNIPIYKKKDFSSFINTIPLLSTESIYQRGQLLITLCREYISQISPPTQKLYGSTIRKDEFVSNKINTELYMEYNSTEMQDLFKFLSNLMNNIIHGSVTGVTELLQEYLHLFTGIEYTGHNYRLLKNRCIMTCTMACHYALQANALYGRMAHILVKSFDKIERSNNTDDIIRAMFDALVLYASSVSSLSDIHYSIHVKQTLQYIRNHFSEKLTLKQLADTIHVNHIYLSNLINKETNMSLSGHINTVRIEESKYLLVHTNKSIQEISLAVGYNYQNHYNVNFKKLVGVSPSEYRKERRDFSHSF